MKFFFATVIAAAALTSKVASAAALPEPYRSLAPVEKRINEYYQLNLFADTECTQYLDQRTGNANPFLDNVIDYSGPWVQAVGVVIAGEGWNQMQLNGKFVCAQAVNAVQGISAPECAVWPEPASCYPVPNGGLYKIELSVGQDFSFDLPGRR